MKKLVVALVVAFITVAILAFGFYAENKLNFDAATALAERTGRGKTVLTNPIQGGWSFTVCPQNGWAVEVKVTGTASRPRLSMPVQLPLVCGERAQFWADFDVTTENGRDTKAPTEKALQDLQASLVKIRLK